MPVRLHDFSKINDQFELENYEFHFSFKEILEGELNARNFPSDKKYSIHLPDYIDSSTIIDPLSENNFIKHKSEEIINKAIIFARELQEKTSKDVPIIGSFSICKSEKEIFYENYKKLQKNMKK